MSWDKPEIKIDELTREQAIAHIKRQAAFESRHGHKHSDEVKARMLELEADNYNYGYILDKIWFGLTEHGGLDSKVDWHKQPREIVNAFWKIVCDKKVLQQKVDLITVAE